MSAQFPLLPASPGSRIPDTTEDGETFGLEMRPKDIAFGLAIVKWIEIRRSVGIDHLPTAVDFAKSALLLRLLSGKPPLPAPPPTSFGRPWYAVVEEKGPHPCVVRGILPDPRSTPSKTVMINDAHWTVVERIDDESAIVQWPRSNDLYRLIRRAPGDVDWTIQRTEPKPNIRILSTVGD